jgi:hypothetical protein
MVSFGGILTAVLLQQIDVISDAGTFLWGSLAGSFMLGYLDYIKPRKDVVALYAPLYGVIIFLVPLEYTPTLLLQLLFTASITVLLVRLNKNLVHRRMPEEDLNPWNNFCAIILRELNRNLQTSKKRLPMRLHLLS